MVATGVVHGIGGAVKRNTSILVIELSPDEIEQGRDSLDLIFNQAKAVPQIQKVHSMTVVNIDKIECKIYSNSGKKFILNF
ncbi:hypothetical protein I4U23_022393 [Adineta vaga]|nr:hypothetical protein I4U23_022393 [Adineta vaga]